MKLKNTLKNIQNKRCDFCTSYFVANLFICNLKSLAFIATVQATVLTDPVPFMSTTLRVFSYSNGPS